MQEADALLASALSDWVASLPAGSATLSPMPITKGGGGGFLLASTRENAAPLRIWVGDDPEYFTVKVGSWATWDQLPLSPESVKKMCASVACGGFLEEAWKLGSLTLARRASLIVGGDRILRWGTLSPFLLIPFSRWMRRTPEPWLG